MKTRFTVCCFAFGAAALACHGGAATPVATNEHILYSDGLHNENTEMLALDDRILLVFRGGESGQIGSDRAHLNVFASMDKGQTFTKQAEISGGALPGMRDIRDPKLVQFNDTLYLYAISRLPGGHYRDLYGEAWTVRSQSTDRGVTWSDPEKTLTDVDGGIETFWGLWRFTPRTFTSNGSTRTVLHAVGYDDGDTAVAFFESDDAINWTKISTVVDRYVDVPSETELKFFGDNQQTAVAIVRMDNQGILQDGQSAICVSTDPFTDWSCRRRIEQRFDGPTWLSRDIGGVTRNFVFARKHLPCTFKRTALYELKGDLTDPMASIQVCELQELKSAGDTAYTSIAPIGADEVLLSWYSTPIPASGGDIPWLAGTYASSDIWLANVDLSAVGTDCPAPPQKVECAEAPLPTAAGTIAGGSFLIGIAPVIYPSQTLLLQATITGATATAFDLTVQPLDSTTHALIDTPWVLTGVPIAADGTFVADLGMRFLPAEAFTLLSDPFLTLNDFVLTGKATSADSFCGDVGGYAQVLGDSPSDRIDLTGSTFAALRITGALPDAVSRCAPPP